jgi:hypothetical protein
MEKLEDKGENDGVQEIETKGREEVSTMAIAIFAKTS